MSKFKKNIIANIAVVSVFFGALEANSLTDVVEVSSYTQDGGVFLVGIEGQGNQPGVNNGEVVSTSSAVLGDTPTVGVVSLDGVYFIGGKYTILTTESGIYGKFAPIVKTLNMVTDTPLELTPLLEYQIGLVGPNEREGVQAVLVDFQTPFIALSPHQNGRHVAEQLTLISTPTVEETVFLNNLLVQPIVEIQDALFEMSGSQYAQMMLSTELANHQFLRRLYDPVRPFLTTDPCYISECDFENTIGFWLEGSGLYSKVACKEHGFKNSGYEVSGGLQFSPDLFWIFGAGLTYDRGNSNFHVGDGMGRMNTLLGAIYGAYRNDDFYVLTDLVVGGSKNHLTRSFTIGTTDYEEEGRPNSSQEILYIEGGVHMEYEGMFVQPFLGIEVGHYNYYSFKETGSDLVGLNFRESAHWTCDSRMGLHVTPVVMECGTSIAFDFAWMYRFTDVEKRRDAHFATFGDTFVVNSTRMEHSSWDAAISFTQELNDVWSFYLTASGEFWSNARAFDVIGGFSASW